MDIIAQLNGLAGLHGCHYHHFWLVRKGSLRLIGCSAAMNCMDDEIADWFLSGVGREITLLI